MTTPVQFALFDPSVRILGEGRYFNAGAAYLAAALAPPLQVRARTLRGRCFYSGVDDAPPEPQRPVLIAYHAGVPVVIGNNSLVRDAPDDALLSVLEVPEEALDLVTVLEAEVQDQRALASSELRHVSLLEVTHPDGAQDLFWLRGFSHLTELLAYLHRVFYDLLHLRGLGEAELREQVQANAQTNMLIFPLDGPPYGLSLLVMPSQALFPRTAN